MKRNIAIYPWFKFLQALSFWQATWFLYFESRLSSSEVILLYVVYDVSTTILEVPSGYLSDRLGRRLTLLAAGFSGLLAAILFVLGDGFLQFALANVLLGGATAFASGTDSALVYESLSATGDEKQIEAVELKAWRFRFVAAALSALIGGAMALFDNLYPYIATAFSATILLALTCFFEEPSHKEKTGSKEDFRALLTSFTNPTLVWLLVLTLLMYVFSHIPFIFGQPFIREALTSAGYASQTPLVSGTVTFFMMLSSVAATSVAPQLRQRMGLVGIILLAFGMQIALTAALAASNGLFVIGLLFLRMVPDALSQPFVKARIQPLLRDGIRATYMSVQSLSGRILFAVTLSFAATQSTEVTTLPYSDIRLILAAYTVVGCVFWAALLAASNKARV